MEPEKLELEKLPEASPPATSFTPEAVNVI